MLIAFIAKRKSIDHCPTFKRRESPTGARFQPAATGTAATVTEDSQAPNVVAVVQEGQQLVVDNPFVRISALANKMRVSINRYK